MPGDDILHLVAADGRTVAIPPLAIGSVLDEVPDIQRSQLVQTGSSTLRVRLALAVGSDTNRNWQEATSALRLFLDGHGLGEVQIVRAEEAPEQSGRGGKFRKVIRAIQAPHL